MLSDDTDALDAAVFQAVHHFHQLLQRHTTVALEEHLFLVLVQHRLACAFRQHVQGLVVFGAALVVTSVSLAALRVAAPDAGRVTELVVLVMANLAATVLRFAALRGWVFNSRSAS